MSGFHHQNVLPVSTDYFLLRLECDTARRKETAEPGASASRHTEVRQTESR